MYHKFRKSLYSNLSTTPKRSFSILRAEPIMPLFSYEINQPMRVNTRITKKKLDEMGLKILSQIKSYLDLNYHKQDMTTIRLKIREHLLISKSLQVALSAISSLLSFNTFDPLLKGDLSLKAGVFVVSVLFFPQSLQISLLRVPSVFVLQELPLCVLFDLRLGQQFVVIDIISPLISLGETYKIYPAACRYTKKMELNKEIHFCQSLVKGCKIVLRYLV